MSVSINWIVKSFDQLLTSELYAILKLRSEVFVVEQNCVYLDADGKDAAALHLFSMEGDRCIAYLRIMGQGNYYKEYSSIGRVVVHPDSRGQRLAYGLIEQSLIQCKNNFPTSPIKISAQKYLQHFYEKCGFAYQGEDYLEDGIPHCAMYYLDIEK